MAINNITIPATTKTSVNLQVRVGVGVNQILSPISAYNVSYMATDVSEVKQQIVRLAPNNTYFSPSNNEITQLLVINTNNSIDVNFTTDNNKSSDITVNSIFIIDSPLKNYNFTNMGISTALITLNIYSILINTSVDLTYHGALPDNNVYDSKFIKSLTVQGFGISNTFTDNVLPLQYSWYAYATSLGSANFEVNGFTGGYELVSSNINVDGVLYTLYRSDNYGLGVITVTAF